MRFVPGCNCCAPASPCGAVTVDVIGCATPVYAGSPVTLSLGGTTVGTDTTNLRVGSISMAGAGTGYSADSLPAVSFSGGGGSGAAATAALTAVAVSTVTLTSGGSGYTAPPLVSITGGNGSGATAFTRLAATSVAGIRLGAGHGFKTGTGYPLAFSGDGTGAAGTYDVDSNNAVTHLVLTSGGNGYTSPPSITFPDLGSAPGVTATAVLTSGSVTSLNLLAGSGWTNGTGYALGLSGGNGTGAAGTFDVIGGAVTNVVVTSGGANYTVLPTVSFSAAGAGTNAAGTAFLVAAPVGTLTRSLAGSGYTTTPTLTIAPPTSGVQATGTATLASQGVASIKVTNPGSNFTSAPTVSIAPPASGTTATAGTVTMGTFAWFPITSTGTYTASATPPASMPWWNPAPSSVSITVTICANGGNGRVTLVPATGYGCPCTTCRDALPLSATLTDANGTYHLVWNANFGWEACYLLPGQTVYGAADPSSGTCGSSTGTGSVPVSYRLTCPTAGQGWKLQQFWAGCHRPADATGVQLGGVPGTCGTATDPNLASGGTGLSPTSGQVLGTGGAAPSTCNNSASFTMTAGYVNGTVAVSFP
jgi:hypothetical protein